MARARRLAQPLVLAFVDVDPLKAVDDTHGHAAGDRLLVAVAGALRSELRSHDLVIRWGGDEFICAALGMTVAQAAMRRAQVNPHLADSLEQGSVTIGLA